MRRIRVLVAACGLACATWTAHSPAPVRATWVPYGYVDAYVLRYPQSAWAIARAAAWWGVSYRAMLALAECESGLYAGAYNAQSGASGLYQWMPGTYWSFAPRIGEGRSYWSAWASANVAAYAISRGYGRLWVCW
jgi:hypothetical protein